MNFTSMRPKAYDTWTTSRYLLPPRSKMTRLSPTKSTVLPNCCFFSAGLAQRALASMANHAPDRTLGMRLTRPEFFQSPKGNHLHREAIACHQSGDNPLAVMVAYLAPKS